MTRTRTHQLSMTQLFEGRSFGRSDFWMTPNGKEPPYLMAIVERAGNILDSKWASFFVHHGTGKIGMILYVSRDFYWFVPPTMMSARHTFGDRDQRKRERFHSWRAVAESFDLLIDWKNETLPLSKEEGPLKDFNDLLD